MLTKQPSGPKRLAELGLSIELIARVLGRADAETEDCTPLDPPIMEGMLRWGRMTRFLREELIAAGWSYDNPRNLARTIHPSGEFAIVVATGDERTGLADGEASARHRKGRAMEQAIHTNGQLAFDLGAMLSVTREGKAVGVGALRMWLLLFYADEEVFRAELSLPEAFEDGRITRWAERILLPAIPREWPIWHDEIVDALPAQHVGGDPFRANRGPKRASE